MEQLSPPSPRVTSTLRTVGINPHHWYAVARSDQLQTRPLGVTLWHQEIVLFRDPQGQVQALEDRCPHRQVRLSQGVVVGDRLECAYHGWQFDGRGLCVEVPYLEPQQKLPTCRLKVYPVVEQDGFIWIFPGDRPPSEASRPLPIPEWDDLNYIATVASITCQAHFSYLIENLMDMYHGHLHQNWQAWADPHLLNLEVTDHQVTAYYQAQSYYRIDKIWSISQLFFPALRRLHPEPLTVSYLYPHWVSSLGQDFKIYCLFRPVSPTATEAYLIHFTSLQAFKRLHRLPVAFRRWIKNRLFGAAQHLLDGLVVQDVAMIEQEQQAHWAAPEIPNVELNRALGAVQRLILAQALSSPPQGKS